MTLPTKQPLPGKRIVGIQKAGQYAGVSRWTINEWLAAGKLPYLRYPGKNGAVIRRIDLDDVDRFIKKSRDRNAAG